MAETPCFFEVNHPEDLRRAEAYLAAQERAGAS